MDSQIKGHAAVGAAESYSTRHGLRFQLFLTASWSLTHACQRVAYASTRKNLTQVNTSNGTLWIDLPRDTSSMGDSKVIVRT